MQVIVVLDGDDWLASSHALSLLCPAYNLHGYAPSWEPLRLSSFFFFLVLDLLLGPLLHFLHLFLSFSFLLLLLLLCLLVILILILLIPVLLLRLLF